MLQQPISKATYLNQTLEQHSERYIYVCMYIRMFIFDVPTAGRVIHKTDFWLGYFQMELGQNIYRFSYSYQKHENLQIF